MVRRFYKDVSVAPEGDGFAVLLDGKPVKTPARAGLVLPTREIAEAVAQEWREQGEELEPAKMLRTKLANTALDRVHMHRLDIIAELLGFAKNDLLCYREDASAELAARQKQNWDPLLEWAAANFGARLKISTGIVHVAQDPDAILAFERTLKAREDMALAAIHTATTVTGSLVLALALADGKLTSDQAFDLGHLDEFFQAERWGRDHEAEIRLSGLKKELETAALFLASPAA
jgi:chaperone required for assembly of F1-ATPase